MNGRHERLAAFGRRPPKAPAAEPGPPAAAPEAPELLPVPLGICKGIRTGERRRNKATGFTVTVESFLAEAGRAPTAALCRTETMAARVIDLGRLSDSYCSADGLGPAVAPLADTPTGRWEELHGAGPAELRAAGFPDLSHLAGARFARAYWRRRGGAAALALTLTLPGAAGRRKTLHAVFHTPDCAAGPWLQARPAPSAEEGRRAVDERAARWAP